MRYVNSIKFLFFLSLLFSCSNEGNEIEERGINMKQLTNSSKVNKSTLLLVDKIHIMLPSHLELMSQEMLDLKYPMGNQPTEVYTDSKGAVNVVINHTNNKVSIKDLPNLIPVFHNQFSGLFPDIKWSQKKILEINNRDFVLLEFETQASDTRIYNLMAVSSLEDRMIVCSFNCPIRLRDEWKEQAYGIINSIKVN